MIAPVVSQEWWQEHRDEVVTAYVLREGGAPGSGVVVDLERWLSAPASPAAGRHPLPDPAVFAQGMAQAGVGDTDTVVAWDDVGGVFAARLVWMLRVTGHEAALLDGVADAAPPAPREPAVFRPVPWPAAALADVEDVLDPAAVVIDARPRERFHGAPDPLDPRPGHVPGARSLPCREHVGPGGRLLPVEVLRRRLRDVGVDGSRPVVSYCGSGVTACHNLLVMEHVGLGTGRLYPGSWSQYASDPARPVEVS